MVEDTIPIDTLGENVTTFGFHHSFVRRVKGSGLCRTPSTPKQDVNNMSCKRVKPDPSFTFVCTSTS